MAIPPKGLSSSNSEMARHIQSAMRLKNQNTLIYNVHQRSRSVLIVLRSVKIKIHLNKAVGERLGGGGGRQFGLVEILENESCDHLTSLSKMNQQTSRDLLSAASNHSSGTNCDNLSPVFESSALHGMHSVCKYIFQQNVHSVLYFSKL